MAQVATIHLTSVQEDFVNQSEEDSNQLFRELQLIDPVEARRGSLVGMSYTPSFGDRVYHAASGRDLNKGLRPRPEVRLGRDGGLEYCQPQPISLRLEGGTFYVRHQKSWEPAELFKITDPVLGPAGPQDWSEVYQPHVPTYDDLDSLRERGFIDRMPRNSRHHTEQTSCSSITDGRYKWDAEWTDPRFRYVVRHGIEEGNDTTTFRLTLGKFLVRAGWSTQHIDYAYEKLWLKVGELVGSAKELELHEYVGEDIVTAYENGVGDKSCMTDRPEWTRFYAEHPEKISLAVASASGGCSDARCILWHLDNGYVVHDRVYTSGLYPGTMRHMLQAKYGDRLVAAWDDTGVLASKGLATQTAISGCVLHNLALPSNKSLPYLDNALYRWHPDKAEISVDIFPFGSAWNDWATRQKFYSQGSYTGGPCVDDETTCDHCHEGCDEDDLHYCSDGDSRCSSCVEDEWIYIEGHDEYQYVNDCCLCTDGEWALRDNCHHIPGLDEYVNEDDIEEYLHDMVSRLMMRRGTDTVIELLTN